MAVVGDAYVVVRAITTGFREQVERELEGLRPALDKAGRDLGNGFSSNFKRSSQGMFGKLGQEADQARAAFNKMTRAGYFMAPAIAGAASAIGDLIFALGGMIAGIGRATPALAVLGSGLVALAQAGITAKIAFGGVGKAISALLKDQGNSANDDKDTIKRNKKAIEDAKKALDKARQRMSELQESFDERQIDGLTRIEKAYAGVSQAYKDATEYLQQLRFEAEGAAYSQERAAIQLERARETLMRVQDLPPDNRARREAEVAFKEAELNYRMAADKASDLGDELAEANAKGVEGSDQVVNAKQDLIDATEDLQKLERDHARSMEDAYDAVEEAEYRLAEARKKAKDDLDAIKKGNDAIADAMKDLSPEAQRFAKYIASLKPVFLDLREAAGKNLFVPLENALQNLVDNLVPKLLPILRDMGGAIGDIAVKFSNMLTTPKNLAIFERVFGERNIKIVENLGQAFVNIGDAFLTILDAVSPLAVTLSEFINEKTASWASDLAGDTQGLSDMFKKAAEAAKTIGTALSGLWDGFKAFGKMSSDMGLDLIKSLGDSGRAMADFFTPKTKKGQEEMKAKFAQIGENTKAIGNFLGEVMKLLFDLSGNPGVKDFFDAISTIPAMFKESGVSLAGVGKLMGEFFVALAEVLVLFLDTGGIEMFFSILTEALGIVKAIFSNEIVKQIFLFLASIKGITLAFGTAGKALKFFGLATIIAPLKMVFGLFTSLGGGLVSLANGIMNFGGKWAKFKDWLLLVRTAIGSIMIDIGKFFSKVFSGVGKVFSWFKGIASSALNLLTRAFGAIGNIVSKVAGFAMKALSFIRGAFMTIVQLVIGGIRAIGVAAAANPVGAIIIGITILVGLLILAYNKSETFRNIVNAAFAKIKEVISNVVNWLMEWVPKAFEFIKNAFLNFSILGLIISHWDEIVAAVQNAVEWIKEKASAAFEFIKDAFLKYTILGLIISHWDEIVEKIKFAADWMKEKLSAAWQFVKDVFLKFTPLGIIISNFDKIINFLKGLPQKFKDAAGNIWGWLTDGLKTAWNSVKEWWNNNVAGKGVKFELPDFLPGPDEITLNIPKFADGGVVYPRSGGVLGVLAEAGRAERVEPLDQNGLSARDKAMIDYLSGMSGGTSGGNTFNVYPSQGMNEAELARSVSRQVAWQYRRGA